jgi:hypothetical protein
VEAPAYVTRLQYWRDSPEEYAVQLAVLMSRMSPDTPVGALNYEEETWDVVRVRHVESTWKKAGLNSLVAAARHRSTGELAAYTVLQVSDGKPWLATQDDTLVAGHHRGHRLGMLVKIRNIRRLLAGFPDVERIITFNAAENDHMLSINVALGSVRRNTTANGRRRWQAITWNAGGIRHMLAINISLGFKTAGFEGEWQKRLE